MHRHTHLRRAVCLAALFMSHAAEASAASILIRALGETLGTLNVSTYTGEVTATGVLKGDIIANFTLDGQSAGGERVLEAVAPFGTTWLQTVKFTSDTQQRLFRTAGGNDLLGTFSDPPQGGYLFPDGTRHPFDNRPWYNVARPSGFRGDIPPNYALFGGNQYRDTPMIPFAPFAGTPGLAGIFNGKAGRIEFETVLAGVCNLPANALNGTYKVCVLGQFYWGYSFTYTGNGLGAAPYNAADYEFRLDGLTVSTVQQVRAPFAAAFDQRGDNRAVEWLVNFVPADQCPEPSTILAAGAGLLIVISARWRPRGRRC